MANNGSGTVSVLLGNGDGTFWAPTSFSSEWPASSVAVGDFNGDGKSDLAVGNVFFGNRVSVWLGTGTGSFNGPTHFVTGKDPRFVTAGDFNADGRGDLVVTNLEADTVTILLGQEARQSPTTQFCAAAYSLNEGGRSVRLTVSRGGDLSGAALVGYLTSDADASARRDYTAALGTLRFAPGEAGKSINVLLTDDAFAEGAETFTVRLFNPSGTTLGTPATATVTINDKRHCEQAEPRSATRPSTRSSSSASTTKTSSRASPTPRAAPASCAKSQRTRRSKRLRRTAPSSSCNTSATSEGTRTTRPTPTTPATTSGSVT